VVINMCGSAPHVTAATSDRLLPELERLRSTAIHELDTHVRDGERCGQCGTPWPCQRAELAAFTLDAV
jgi:hypothetical protein